MAFYTSNFLLLWLSFTATSAFSQLPAGDPQGNAASIQSSRDTLAQWIETQRIISSEESSWQTTKLALEGRVALVQQELDDLNNKVSQSNKTIAEEETRKSNLQRELDSAKSSTQALIDAAGQMEAEIMKLKTILPDPILKKVQALYERIPEDPNSTKVSLAERYQNILGILNEADKANNELMVLSEVREIAGASPTEVETIYVGLAQAYFVNADRNFAGTGRPVNGKWQWERLDEISSDVAEMLSVISAKGKPKFVHLPIQID
jgi:septal ring factor EnvC (AmiA/AmiB activator)